jgi:CheY-like chemotaxis protein/HPt (histidine-containing phosphotransfer) domain-containing protein
MSHEIRTPLTAVLGYADLLLDAQISASERLCHVQTIRRNGEHLLAILSDILDLSKIEAGKLEIERIPCSTMQVIADVASLMRLRAIDKQLGFMVEFATPIPVSIQSDPTRLRQVLMNLIGNAIKFSSAGTVTLRAHCSPKDSGDGLLEIDVIDQGIGMTPDQLMRLFQPFSQADASTTRRYGGTGLGLVICQRLAEMLGGKIAVQSKPGVGSTFTLQLSVGQLEGVEMVSDYQEAGPTPKSTDSSLLDCNGRVLLAEDGIDNQLLISTHLCRAGAFVDIVSNGKEAVAQALAAQGSGTPYDLILMDMQMPELDGYGATALLRSKSYRGKIVALTAHAMATDRERCLNAGCNEYLTKPINRVQLLTMVQWAIAESRNLATVDNLSTAANLAAGFEQPTVPRQDQDSCALQGVDGSAAPVADPLFSLFADDPEMAPLVEKFISNLPERIRELDEARARHDHEALSRIAHQLKGAAAGYGFSEITTSAAQLEDRLRHGADAAGPADELIALCRRAAWRPVA